MSNMQKIYLWYGVALILIIDFIHVIDAPDILAMQFIRVGLLYQWS